MDNLGDMRTAIQRDLNVNSSSTFYTPTIIDAAINRSKRKAEGLYRWPGLEDAKKTSSIANQEYYDYPDDWRPFSIWKLWVNSDDNDFQDPLVFKDYLYEKENDFPSDRKTIWANQWKRFFFVIDGVVVASNGTNNIKIWGFKTNTNDLETDNDETIFTNSIPVCNEAILEEAKAILKSKAGEQSSDEFYSGKAKGILITEWGKLKQEFAKGEKTQPFFDVPDYFGQPRTADKIGNF